MKDLVFRIVLACAMGVIIGGGVFWWQVEAPPPPAPVLETTALAADPPRPGPGQVRTTLIVRDGDTGVALDARVNGRPLAGPLTGAPGRELIVRATGYSEESVPARKGAMEVLLWNPRRQSRVFGSTPGRTRVLELVDAPTPGNRQQPQWQMDAGSLLEFPPAVAEGVLVLGTNGGRVQALDATTGSSLWRTKIATVAASPAIAHDTAYLADMKGVISAFTLRGGTLRWRLRLGSPVETSPLLIDGRDLVVGTWDGRLLRINGRSGRIQWTQRLDGAVKGAAALSDRDTIIVGDYSGAVWSLHKRTGRVMWRAAAGARFYGGPAVVGNYVVIGDVGGEVIALHTANGRERWRRSMGGYVYGSPAIDRGSAFIGSYSGRFERLDLDTGRVQWSFDAGQRISGSAYISGDTVYLATLYRPGEPRHTFGLDVRTGAKQMDRPDGRYTAATSAGRMLYLIGVRTIRAFPAR